MRRINEDLIEISDTVRIERGHVRKQAVATKELLDSKVTAAHYHVGGRDAAGKKIQLGEPMDYIDWLKTDRVWYVYKLIVVEEEVDGKLLTVSRFMPQQSFADEAEAVVFAMGL